jgi:carboxyl-terminal processing protease
MTSTRKTPRRLTKYLLVACFAIASVISFSFVNDNYFEISKNLDIFATLFREVNTYYVDEVEPSKLMRTGIDAMLESLDPYTNYISEAEAEDYRMQMTGQYVGIGAIISPYGDYVVINEPYEGYPAQKEDLRPGDIILEIDGKDMYKKNTSEVSKMLRGQPNTTVKLKIKRNNEDMVKVISRQEIQVKNVPYYGMIDEHTGYIKQTGFTTDCGKEVRDALTELKKNAGLTSVILDLRFNPGGLLHESVNVVNVFTPKNQVVVNQRGKVKEWDHEYKTLNQGIDTDIPLVVIVNRNSASASEIVSGTIQDIDRGVIIGQRSFGKGLVQSTRPLSFNSQLKVTIAKYYTPSGRCIQALDYTHRNEDGSVGAIADSLRKEFNTRNGRKVYDGGGVTPDVVVEPRKLSSITSSLITKNIIFDFATKFRNEHESIASAKDFKLSETEWMEFLKFIENKDYSYTNKTEQALEEFRKKAEDDKSFTPIASEYEMLKSKLSHDKKNDIQQHKTEIIEFIEAEITKRYYYQKATVEASFDDDPEIQAALGLFGDMKRYNALLNKK